jgi:UDP-glucose 4-epimerase
MSVLCTGATTPLGRALVRTLLEDGRVLAIGREACWPGEPHERLDYLSIDLTRSRDLRDLLFGPARDAGVTAIAHLSHHRSLRARGQRAHSHNVDATREMLRLAERHPTIERFVYVGSAEVYRAGSALPSVIDEDHPIEMAPEMPQRVRDRVEADFTVCARMGLSRLSIAVLRLAELFAADSGSQLADYVASRVCFRPLGFDPMIELISIDDAVNAVRAALGSRAQGVFNVPGADVLPLSALIERARRSGIPVPSLAIGPLYAARALLTRTEFDWTMQRRRLSFGAVLDGTRAREVLGYRPQHPISW